MTADWREYLDAHICKFVNWYLQHLIAAEGCPSPNVSFKCLPILLVEPTEVLVVMGAT